MTGLNVSDAALAQTVVCETCGRRYGIGQSPFCRDGHARVLPSKGFEPYFDIGLGREVTGWGDIHQAMRREHLDYRDHPSPARLAERRDRIRERQAHREA